MFCICVNACALLFFARCIVTLVDCVLFFYRKWCVQNEINLFLQIEHDWYDQMHLRILSVFLSSLDSFASCNQNSEMWWNNFVWLNNNQEWTKKNDKNWLCLGRNTIFGQGVNIFLAFFVVNGNILTNGLKWKALISIWWNDFWYGNVMESLAPTFVCHTNC